MDVPGTLLLVMLAGGYIARVVIQIREMVIPVADSFPGDASAKVGSSSGSALYIGSPALTGSHSNIAHGGELAIGSGSNILTEPSA